MGNLTNDLVVPTIRATDFEMDLFVMGFQEYKNTWTLVKNEKLETRMKPENEDKNLKTNLQLLSSEEIIPLLVI